MKNQKKKKYGLQGGEEKKPERKGWVEKPNTHQILWGGRSVQIRK